MKGILILAHGSRVPETKETINRVTDMVRKKLPDMPIEIAYMDPPSDQVHRSADQRL